MTVMELLATLKMDVSSFLSGSREAKAEAQSLNSVVNETGEKFGFTAAEIKKMNTDLMDFAGKAAAVGASLTASVTLPIAELAAESLKLASSFQQAEIGFTTLMGSGTQAAQFLKELKDFAAATPFEFPDLQRAAGRLQAMGFEAKAVIPIMEAVGNAAAMLGTGEAGINRITLALGQMANSAKVTSQDMNQLVQANIGAWQYLAESVGKSVSETKDMVKAGLISGTEGVIAVLEGMNAKFAGGMQGQMVTLAGQWSNLKDQISFVIADIGKALTPFAQTVLQVATPVLDFVKSLVEGFKGLPEGMQGAIVAAGTLAAAIGPLALAFAGFTATVSALGSMLGVAGVAGILSSLAPVIIPLTAAIIAAGAAWEAWKLEPVREAVTGIWQTLQSFWSDTLKPVIETVSAAAVAFGNFASDLISSGLQAAWEGLQTVGMTLMNAVASLAAALAPLWDAFANVLDSLSPLLQPIEDLLGFLGKMVIALVESGLVLAWEGLKVVLGLVSEAVSTLATLIGNSLLTFLGALAGMVREVSQVWDALFKPAIQGAIDAVKSFLGTLAQIPGVKQAIEGVNSVFDSMREKVTGAVNDARETVRGWGEDTKSSMQKSKEALDSAQKAYSALTEKAKEGKATEEEITKVTEQLSRAKADYRQELERVRPRQEELTRAVKEARTEFDNAEQNLRKTQKAMEEGKASASDLASAQTRVNDASVALKTAQSALNDITKQTGESFKEYGGGVDAVKESLRAHNDHAQTAKERQAALKAEVDAARQEFVKAFQAYQSGVGDVEAVKAAFENLQAAQDNQHPEKAAERFIKARQDEKAEAEKNMKWYEETYLPRYTAMVEAEIAANLKLQTKFDEVHSQMKTKALEAIPIVVELDKRLPEELRAMIEFTDAVSAAYKQLGINSTASIEQHAKDAQIAYETIKNSGIASATDILKAEKVALQAKIEAVRANGDDIAEEDKKRLKQLEEQLDTHIKYQKTSWENLSKDLVQIGQSLNRDIASAFVDLFEGKGWDSFKTAGVQAMEHIGQAVIKVALEAVEGYLIKKLKDIFMENGLLDGLTEAFKKFGKYIIDLFGEIGDLIVGGVKAAIGWISGAASGAGSAAASAAGSAASTAGSAASSAGGAASTAISAGLTGIVGAVSGVVTAVTGVIGVIQGMHQSADLGRIEENTRFAQIGIVGNGGLVVQAAQYWPKLEGIERFNYDILAPVLGDISDNIIGKGDNIYRALVVEVRNELIDIKNNFHDVLFSSLDNGTVLTNIYQTLGNILNAFNELKLGIASIDRASAQSALADQQQASDSQRDSVWLQTMNSSIQGLGPMLTSAISNLDFRGSLGTLVSNIGSSLSATMSSVDVRGTLSTGFSLLSSQLAGLSGSISAASQMRVQAPQTNVYMTVNGSTSAANTASLASQLASYGIKL